MRSARPIDASILPGPAGARQEEPRARRGGDLLVLHFCGGAVLTLVVLAAVLQHATAWRLRARLSKRTVPAFARKLRNISLPVVGDNLTRWNGSRTARILGESALSLRRLRPNASRPLNIVPPPLRRLLGHVLLPRVTLESAATSAGLGAVLGLRAGCMTGLEASVVVSVAASVAVGSVGSIGLALVRGICPISAVLFALIIGAALAAGKLFMASHTHGRCWVVN